MSAAWGEQGPASSITLTFSSAPESNLYVSGGGTASAGIDNMELTQLPGLQLRIDIRYQAPAALSPGTYADVLTFRVCTNSPCTTDIPGSPLSVRTYYEVLQSRDPVRAPLPAVSRAALPHDVVDAEYSRSLDRLVMVAQYPVNALYVYDTATGTESVHSLNKVPTSVSVSPDGRTAAVGHDALISIVDLQTVGQSGAPAPLLLDVSAVVFDLVLDGRGFVHAFPRVDQWVVPHSVQISTNTEQLGSWLLYAGSHARLHPSANFVYTADNGLSPSDIAKWDITTGTATRLYDSPYHGEYGMCGNVWFNESGTRIYTACGNVFRSNVDQAQDMVYAGRLELTGTNYQVSSLDHFAARGEVAVLEGAGLACSLPVFTSEPCYQHVAVFEDQFLSRLAAYSIPPVAVGSTSYTQLGKFLFYNAAGTRKLMITRLVDMPNPDAEYYLTILQ